MTKEVAHIKKIRRINRQSIEQLKWAIEMEWEAIPQAKINEYVLQMPDRIMEVVKRKGLSTQY